MCPSFLLIPDSFKGTLSSRQICAVMEKSIHRLLPEAKVTAIPVADGGEGSMEALLDTLGGAARPVTVSGPWGKPVSASYGVLSSKTAVIEMATCAGLPLAGEHPDPESTTTYGVGEMMLHAVQHGCDKIILCLGGSATNDGGAGAAAALGVRFFRADGTAFVPTGKTLGEIASISLPRPSPLEKVQITYLCDVDNPLNGEDGAAAVFAPQKGADAPMVNRLRAGLCHYSRMVTQATGREEATLPGSGAAGGLGYGLHAFFGGTYQRGIDTILDLVHFEDLLPETDWIFTGEGKIDAQTLGGKVVAGVARRAKPFHVPVVAVVGDIEDHLEALYEQGVWGIFSINRRALPFSEAKKRAAWDMEWTVDNLVRFISRRG